MPCDPILNAEGKRVGFFCVSSSYCVSRFGDMFHALRDNLRHVVVGQRVKDELAVFAIFHQSRLFQCAQLMRNGRLIHVQHVRQVLHAHFRGAERVKNFDARRVAKHFEKIR